MSSRRFAGPFRKLASLLGVPEVQQRLDKLEQRTDEAQVRQSQFEAHIDRRIVEIVQNCMTDLGLLLRTLTPHLDDIQRALTNSMLNHTETVANELRDVMRDRNHELGNDLKQRFDAVNNLVSGLSDQLSRHRRYVDNLQIASQQPRLQVNNNADPFPDTSTNVSDAFYVALEDHFRGDQRTIGERQTQYLPIIQRAPLGKGPVLDLGCGRGEWLTVLRDQGVSAEGLDSNAACVAECRTAGLTVHHGEIVEFLRNLENHSYSAVTLFQVLEHLPFPLLIDVLREILRVLVPGGVLIGEVPNSENLTVAASTFWIDPTHQKPLFPGLLKFLAQETGFRRIEGMYSTPLREMPEFSGLDEVTEGVFREIYSTLYGNADFALVAWV